MEGTIQESEWYWSHLGSDLNIHNSNVYSEELTDSERSSTGLSPSAEEWLQSARIEALRTHQK
jgi:hypothetical protein